MTARSSATAWPIRRASSWSVNGPCSRLGLRPTTSSIAYPVVRVKAWLTQTIGEPPCRASVITIETSVAWSARSRISARTAGGRSVRCELTTTTSDRLAFDQMPHGRRAPNPGTPECH